MTKLRDLRPVCLVSRITRARLTEIATCELLTSETRRALDRIGVRPSQVRDDAEVVATYNNGRTS